MDIGKSFSYTFEDDRWVTKSLLGAVVAAIPIVNFALAGYLIDLLKNVMDGAARPLPEWSEFGEKWMKGLMVFVASLIYAIPILILSCIPLTLLGGAASLSGGNMQDNLAGLLTGVGGLFGCLIVIYALLLTFIYPSIYIHYARLGTFGAFFEFGKVWGIISKDFGQYITAWLISLVAGLVVGVIVGIISAVLGIIPCIGWILSWIISAIGGVFVFFIYGHLFGQVGAQSSTSMTVPPAE